MIEEYNIIHIMTEEYYVRIFLKIEDLYGLIDFICNTNSLRNLNVLLIYKDILLLESL